MRCKTEQLVTETKHEVWNFTFGADYSPAIRKTVDDTDMLCILFLL